MIKTWLYYRVKFRFQIKYKLKLIVTLLMYIYITTLFLGFASVLGYFGKLSYKIFRKKKFIPE